MIRRILLLMAVILIIAGPASAQTNVEDIREITLKNSLKFIILEDHSIPNANMYLFFKVGSRNEYPGITGLSHFFEHMMFNGAQKYGPKEFDRVMEAAGGANNAYTNENLTVYTDFFPSSALEVIFDLEADRLGHLALDKKMVESERGVVLSEWTTACENSNEFILSEQVKGTAFLAHPYRWTVLGYESDIRNWSIEDLQRYFDTYYAPNNALVVMVGDINFERIKKMTRTYFESIPSRQPPRPVHTVEPKQRGEKRVYVNKSVSSPYLMIVYHVPQTGSSDYYALDMLNSILSDGRSSRFYSSLVSEQQLALRVFAYMPFALDPNLFYISAVCAAGVDAETLEKAIYKEIDKIVAEGVSERELQKVKNSKLADFYRSMETIDGKADTIGTYEIYFGSYKKLFDAPAEYKKVTPDDIKAAAAKYFGKSNRTVGILKTGEEK